MKEKWREIPEMGSYYECSNLGRVRSWKRKGGLCMDRRKEFSEEPKIMSVQKNVRKGNSQPMYKIRIMHEKEHYNFNIARLIAEVFVPNLKNYAHVIHIDGDSSNNDSSNLKWVDAEGLKNYRIEHGFLKTKINFDTAKEIRRLKDRSKLKNKDIAPCYGISECNVQKLTSSNEDKRYWKY